MKHTDVRNDIIANPTLDPTLELNLVDSENAGDSSRNIPGESGGKDALALFTGRSDLGSESISEEKFRKPVSDT